MSYARRAPSVTGDVLSLRARPGVAGGIVYRFANEYPEEERVYTFAPTEAAVPLSFGELADLFEAATVAGTEPGYEGILWGLLDWNNDYGTGDPYDLRDFVRIVSPFYPGLTRYFEHRTRQWLAGALRRQRAKARA